MPDSCFEERLPGTFFAFSDEKNRRNPVAADTGGSLLAAGRQVRFEHAQNGRVVPFLPDFFLNLPDAAVCLAKIPGGDTIKSREEKHRERRIAVSDSVREEAIREAVKELLEAEGESQKPQEGKPDCGKFQKNPVCIRWNYEEKDGPVPAKII